jgi:hypothetical protein
VPLRLAVLEHESETGLGSFARSLDADVEYDVLKTHERIRGLDEFDGAIVLGGSLSDFDRWRSVPGYRRLVEESGEDWDELAVALEYATRGERLADQLLNRWLHLTAAVKTLRERTQCAA